jgi:hypothetical protein
MHLLILSKEKCRPKSLVHRKTAFSILAEQAAHVGTPGSCHSVLHWQHSQHKDLSSVL